MNFMVLVVSILVLGVVLAAGEVAYRGGLPEDLARGAAFQHELEKIPDPAGRARLARASLLSGRKLEASYGRFAGARPAWLGPLLGLAALHAQVAGRLLPVAASLLLSAAAMGLARRERKRAQMSYSSAMLSYVGKVLIALSTAGYLWTSFSPLGLGSEFLFFFTLSGASGLYLYLAELPPRI